MARPDGVFWAGQRAFDELEEALKTETFLQYENIYSNLPWAGFPGNYLPLSRLKQDRGRQFMRVDDHGLHLVWKNNTQYIKPLPSCFDISSEQLVFESMKPCVRGLFHSYTKLIQTEFDFDLAIEESLLPGSFKRRGGWDTWQQHIAKYDGITFPGVLDRRGREMRLLVDCHPRYQYGSLRLPRLNLIMWFKRPRGRKQFHHTVDPISIFWEAYGTYIVLIFGYVAIALTAMQVILKLDEKPPWVVEGIKYCAYTVLTLILAQLPFYVIVSLFWIFTNSALSTRFISVLLGNRGAIQP